jgi:hypothetical protein
MLVTGRNQQEVYMQMNSRDCVGMGLLEPGPGPGASCPLGATVQPPAPPSVLTWNGSMGAASYAHSIESTYTTANGRWVQGAPFAYGDCQGLVPTQSSFAIVLEWALARTVAPTGTWTGFDVWHRNGVETVQSGQREFNIDLLVT